MPRTMRRDLRSDHRSFWLLVALAVALLTSVSTTTAAARAAAGPAGIRPPQHDAAAADLLRGVERDLAALRAQLERIGAEDAAPGGGALPLRERITLTPGLGDGGRAFRLRSMETMARSLARRVDGLIALQHRAGGDARGLDVARLMSLDARSLRWGIEELRLARAPHLLRAARARVDRALAEIARGAEAVAALQAEPAARPRRAPGSGRTHAG